MAIDLPIQETTSNSIENPTNRIKIKTWPETAIFSLLVLSGQSAATLLGRLYYEKGGKSKYMASLVQTAGFPILLPLIIIFKARRNPTVGSSSSSSLSSSSSSSLALPSLYIFFGSFLACVCMLYSIGLMYLPLSTFSLLSSTQLAFNAFFSHFINSHKITPSILNSIFLLSLSSIILALEPNSSDHVVAGKYSTGFICTLGGAAGHALLQSVEQSAYRKVMKKQTMKEILDVMFYESTAASCVLVGGLFGSGEWRGLEAEVEGFGMGKAAYVAVVVSAAAAWQVFGVGMVSLILRVSSLFGNVVGAVGVPVVPVLAVVVFKDGMSGRKVVALLLALWGSLSFVYQQYLDRDVADDSTVDLSREDVGWIQN